MCRSSTLGESGTMNPTEVRISKRHMLDDAKAAVAKVRTALIQAGCRPDTCPKTTTAP
jgi:hypothetical protein